MGLLSDLKTELWEILVLAGPAFVSQGTIILMAVADSLFVGRIGPDELAASAIATAMMQSFIYIGVGLSFGMDTLVSQAFGAKNFKMVGVYFQIAVLLTSLAALPIGITLFFSEQILVGTGQDPYLAKLAGEYIRWNLIGILPYNLFYCLGKLLQNQRIMTPSVVVGIFGILINIPFNYFFIFYLELGLKGAAIATSLARALMPIMLAGYIWYRGLHLESTPHIHREAFNLARIWEYITYAIPASFMLLFEVFGFNVLTILVGLTQNYPFIDAHAIGFYVIYLAFCFPFGWGVALTIHVGNIIGAGEYQRGMFVTYIGLTLMFYFSVLYGLFIWGFRFQISWLWSTDALVRQKAGDVLAITAVVVIFDAMQFVAGSLLKGLGRQKIGAVINFFVYYVISVPGGAMLHYLAGLEVVGYWWALVAALGFGAVSFTAILARVDWKEEAILASERVGINEEEGDEEELEKQKVAETTKAKDEESVLLDD